MTDDIDVSGLQDKRRHKRFRLFIASTLFVVYCLFLGGSWLVIKSPFFQVQKITFVGNEKVPTDAISDLVESRVISGNYRWLKALLGFGNILIWPQELGDKDLVFLPQLKSVSIEKNYAGRSLAVRVVERQTYGIWCLQPAQAGAEQTQISAENIPRESAPVPQLSASCWWFDGDGVIFQRAISAEGGLILAVHDHSQKNLGLNSRILPAKFIGNIFSIFGVLRESGLSIQEIRLKDLSLQELEVSTYMGPKLYFSLRFPADNALPIIQNFAQKPGFGKLQYLDFRVENRVYYK